MDKALKQRLVGASVLILLAVIVLPMLLSGQSETLQQETVRIEVPARPPELTFETRRFPVGDVPPGAPSTLAAETDPPEASPEAPSDTTGTARTEVERPPVTSDPDLARAPDAGNGVTIAASPAPRTLEEGTAAVDAPPEPAPLPVPVGEGEDAAGGDDAAPAELAAADLPAPPAPSKGRYLVQVASYTISANADNLAARLAALDMDVLRDTVENDANRYHRVRVGPFDDADAAEAAIADITREISDLEPRVLDLKPEELAPVTDPGDPLVRWVVQAGSFSSDANADQLVSELRAAGFEAYREKVSEASTTLFKVRIGPELRRETAVDVAARLEREFDIRGLVMSTD